MHDKSGLMLLEVLATPESARRSQPGAVIGTLAGFQESGEPLVLLRDSEQPLRAISVIPLGLHNIDHEVVLQFEKGDPTKPLILGLVQRPAPPAVASAQAATKLNVELDGEKVVLTADREIVLRCGKSSITLTKAGKIVIRGAYVLSRSAGVNRIKGGSVQIN